MDRLVWSGGQWRAALVSGGIFGLVSGIFTIGRFSLVAWIVVMLVSGAAFGAWIVHSLPTDWPELADLTPGDRRAVVRAVDKGERIGDARLAPVVISYGRSRRPSEPLGSGRWDRWALWALAAVLAGRAIELTVEGWKATHIFVWALAAAAVPFAIYAPRIAERHAARIDRAVLLAQDMLPEASSG